MFDVDQVDALFRPESIHAPRTRLLLIENTQNRGGGSVWPLGQVKRVTARARELGLRTHLDGARIWNACVATGLKPADYAQHFDTVSCCFSKGLGAPVGSAVVGDQHTIARVVRFRKMFGGAMRQCGVLAAAALFALDHHYERLAEDHENAKRLAVGLAEIPGVTVDPSAVETNMVFLTVDPSLGSAAEICARLREVGVLVLPNGPQSIRAVCHLDVPRSAIDQAIDRVAGLLDARAVA